jgi:exosortase C (VPDSG-CTERM-specific)
MDPTVQPVQLTDEASQRQRTKSFLVFSAVLLICFALPLFDLFRFSITNDLYSYILLVPVISGYLIWTDRSKISLIFAPSAKLAAVLLLPGIALLLAYLVGVSSGWRPAHENDRLSLLILAFVLFFTSGTAWFYGRQTFRSIAFPMAFLIFMVPMPQWMEEGFITFLQHASAEASYWFLTLSGMSVLREGTQFTLPGITIGVAPECSGVRSSLVLFMTGVLASYFFLRKPWTKAILIATLIPLGIVRNAFRIFTLAQLAVHVDPNILDSDLHHRGGPIFFAVSLAPFFLLVWLLRKCETTTNKMQNGSPISS